MKKYFLLIAIFALVGCSNAKPYTYDSLSSCNRIQPESKLTLIEFKNEFKYINAQIKDLKKSLKDGEITNVKYQKKMEALEKKIPRKLIKTNGYIWEFLKERNTYKIGLCKSTTTGVNQDCMLISNPFSTKYSFYTIYLDLDNFPRLKTFLDKPDNTLSKDDEVKILFTNLDSTQGGFYYSVVAIKIGTNIFTNQSYCPLSAF